MKVIRWFNRHIWFFPACALITAAVLLVFCVRPLLGWVGWPYGAYPARLLRKIAACVLAGVCIGALWGLGVGLRIRLTGWEIARETARMCETCDPEPVLLACRELQAVWLDGLRPKLVMTVQLSMANAAGLLGRIQEAEQELNRLLPLYERYKPSAQLAVELHAAAVRLWNHKPEDARSFLTEAERHLDQMGGPAPLRTALENRKRLCRLVTEGGSEALLAEFQQELAGSEKGSLLDQVSSHMNVARCLLDLNRPEDVRPHLEFVAANGNKLGIRVEAEACLAALAEG